MTERRSRRRRREDDEEDEEDIEPSDEQTEIAKHVRFSCPTKSSNYRGEKVEYFKGAKAIDCLLDSKWASGQKGAEILFTDRGSAQDYLHALLELGMFKRVTRVRKKKKGDKDDGQKTKEGSKDSPKPTKSKKDSDGNTENDGKKKKVKVKLELHDFQVFLDGDEVYMWIFDPVHPRTIIYGVLVVIGAIVLCLFPLWPMQMREYVWYISVVAAILLGALIVVALLRYVIFGFIWIVTAGRHHFWLLPNLTEECGFLESFVPLYTHVYIKGSKESNESEENQGQDEDKKDDSKDGDGDGDGDVAGKDNEGDVDKKDSEKNSPKTSEDTDKDSNNEAEPWVQVTEEEFAQAKEATGTDNDTQTKTGSEVAC